MKNIKIFSVFDYFLLIAVYILIFIGIFFIYSSWIDADGILKDRQFIKQIIWSGVGFVIMLFFTFYDYRKFDSYAWIIYGLMIFILLFTRIFGVEVKGARSWIGIGSLGFQPSEFGKIGLIIVLSKYLYNTEEENQLKRFVIATLIMLLPMGLVLIQPDLGTAAVYIPIYLFICFFSGIPLRYILYVLFTGLLAILFTMLPIWNSLIRTQPLQIIGILTNMKLRLILIAALILICLIGVIVRRYFHGPKYTYWIIYVTSIIACALIMSVIIGKVLKPHQLSRLIIFMNPNIDPLESGWNIIQSKIAIGSGGAFGQGYLNGTQSHLNYLPEQSTDFIFSILAEETGFVGCFLVFLLYVAIMIRILVIIFKTSNKFGVYIAAGIFGMFSFHFFLNVGMVMGIMPVTGVPLLFLSYGGSHLVMALIAVGLLQSINYRKNEFN